MDKIYKLIQKRSLFYLVICLSGVLIIFAAGIIPEYFSSARLDHQINNVQFQIEEQKNLYPIYDMLKDKKHAKDSRILAIPKKYPVSRAQVDTVPATIGEIAKKVNLDVVSASPDLNFLGSESRFLPMNVIIRGDFFNFRKFLLGLGEVAFLERIEEIQIQQNEDTMEFKMRMWIVVS